MGKICRFRITNSSLSFEKDIEFEGETSLRIGRVESNDISVDDAKISRHHVQAELREERLLVRDLNSRSGTWLNGEKMNHSFHLRPGETFRIGDTEITFEIPSEETPNALQETSDRRPQSHYQFYLQKDLSQSVQAASLPIEAGDEMDRFYRKVLLFPFFLLFVFFVLFPSMTTFLISMTYSGIALYFSKNLLPGPEAMMSEGFRLPITRRIARLQKTIDMKILELPPFDRNLLIKMQKEMSSFVREKLPKMERDIFALNKSLVSGTLNRLEQRREMLENELRNTTEESISLQIQKNLTRLNRQIKMQKNIKNILMHLILKLEDYQIQLEILESTLIAQSFRDNYSDFSTRFLDLQEDIDDVYREYNALKEDDSLLFGGKEEEKPALEEGEKTEALPVQTVSRSQENKSGPSA